MAFLEPLISEPYEVMQRLQNDALDENVLREILLTLTPEKLDEAIISSWLTALLETAPQLPELPNNLMDCCGTGGSGLPHFNTSTIVGFILAAAGIPVVKFGNRGIQQPHGSFDFLSALGFDKPVSIDAISKLIERSNLAFLFAPQCYPYLAPLHRVRKTLTSPTLFHYIGPLLNPVLPAYRLFGISNANLMPMLGNVLSTHPLLSKSLKRAFLIHTQLESGHAGLDELSPIGERQVIEVVPEKVSLYLLYENPNTAVSELLAIEKLLRGIAVDESVAIFQKLMQGETPEVSFNLSNEASISPMQRFAFCYELVVQNAALGLAAANIANNFDDGRQQVIELLESEKVLRTFQQYQGAYDACRK